MRLSTIHKHLYLIKRPSIQAGIKGSKYKYYKHLRNDNSLTLDEVILQRSAREHNSSLRVNFIHTLGQLRAAVFKQVTFIAHHNVRT